MSLDLELELVEIYRLEVKVVFPVHDSALLCSQLNRLRHSMILNSIVL